MKRRVSNVRLVAGKFKGLKIPFKASRYITHIKRLKNCKTAWRKFWDRVKPLGNRMQAILLQLPPSFKNTPETFQRIKKMKTYLPRKGPSIVFEFRD